MTFAHPSLLLLLPIALLLLAIQILGDVRRRRARAGLGDAPLVDGLVTFDAGPRRAIKGALRVLAVVLAIVAVARPRYGRGTKVVPAADVSAVIVLDLSKSMYAQDVLPSRLDRARSDALRMIKTLPRVRWGAVAFAGEAIAFPPTTDALETASFLGAHQPIEMPPGTAIARALELARRQLVPQSSDGTSLPVDPGTRARRKATIILITDGEDLEGDPVAVARTAAGDGIRIHVAAIGGRAPQPIPDVDPATGQSKGYIRDDDGTLVTTELSPQAEDQLKSIAAETKGRFVHAEDGTTGLSTIESELRAMIAKEGTEKVETLFADVFGVPLSIALGLLVLDTLLGEAPRRRRREPRPAHLPDGRDPRWVRTRRPRAR
ncbi:MAG: VWA domain-containing protein [Deltaproteobacteria bacterium]|nr:VWA domain-containing protein [Deltaproteobacteria bacterium]